MMKRVALAAMVLAAVGIVAGTAMAGPLDGGGGVGKGLAAKLGLSDQQKADIRKVIVAAKEEMHTAQGLLGKMKVFHEAWEKVKAILTPEQIQTLQGLRKAHPGLRGKLGGRGAGRKAGPAAEPGALPASIKGDPA